jgi:hypothetical protein|tara:strand:+ start:8911 stop:11862 length:2952 start_codon:yes stop_codon:yes gene_type:complete
MGEIQINLPNESFKVRIKGDAPTVEEQIKINDLVAERRRLARRSSLQSRSREQEQLFDTKSGVKDAGFRAALSFAETAAEEDAILKQKYGFAEGDFTRDKRGRLAITKSGGQKLGIDLEKDTLVDETGFSRYDFADLTGIAPEIVGGVGGAIAGLPLGPVGVIGGSVTGTMAGAGLEESIEAILGVSKQSGAEIAKDIAIEGGITLAGELTFGLAGALFRAGRKGLSVKQLPDEEVTAIGEALTYKVKDPQTGELIDVPITPELAAVGAPGLVARQAKIMERVIGSSDRLKNNYDNMGKILDDFRARSGAAKASTTEDTGEALLDSVYNANQALVASEKAARQSVVKTLSGATDQFMSAAARGADVDEEAFKILSDASKGFDDIAAQKFSQIEDLVNTVVGSKQFIKTNSLKSISERLETEYGASVAAARTTSESMRESVAGDVSAIINGINGLGDTTGFLQLYNLRKALNDGKIATGSTTGVREIQKAIDEIDRMLDPKMLEFYAKEAGTAIDGQALNRLQSAASSLNEARGFFKDGQTAIDNLQDAIKIKDLAARARDGTIPPNVDFLSTLVRNGKPESLKRAIKVVKDFSGAEQAEQLRGLVATRWLQDALKRTVPDGVESASFSGKAFAKSIDDLGKTADTLFGGQVGQVRALAKQIEKASSSNMTEEAILRAVQEGGGEAGGIAGILRSVKEQQDALNQFVTDRTLRKLSSGNITAIEAAEYVASPKSQPETIRSVLNLLRGQGDDEALNKVQSFYMNNILKDFGADTFVDGNAIKTFSKNFNEAGKSGKFRIIFGDEMGKDMEKFGRVLAINAKTAQGGDLVAANIAASPLNNLGKIAKYGVFTRFLTSAPYYKQVIDQYEALSGTLPANKKSEMLGKIISQLFVQTPGQLIQEGVDEANKQATALINNTAMGQQLSSMQNQMTAPNAASSLGSVNVTQPVAGSAGQPSLRQQAANNPGVAQALGIRGSTAGLLGNP